MNVFTIGPAGGRELSRIHGTEVLLAGRTAYMPNSEIPFVVQKLTKAQIDAVNKKVYVVQVIEMSNRHAIIARKIRKYGVLKSSFVLWKKQVQIAGGGWETRFVRKTPNVITVETDSTQEYMTIISLREAMNKEVDKLVDENRRLSRQSGGEPPENTIFYEPIDDGRMSDCILKVIATYFGTNDKCRLCGHDFKLPEFCVLVYYYFLRIDILKNKARQPFSEYIRKKVLENESAFTDKTFNNYANDIEQEEFTDVKRHAINFDFHPKKDAMSPMLQQQLLYAFQEIGHVFHTSDYFVELRKVRERMMKFAI